METQNYGGGSAEIIRPVERGERNGSQRKMGTNIGQHGQLRNHWMKRRKKARRGKDTTQRRKLKQQLEITKTEIQTMYSQKKAVVRIHSMNLQERSSREPTRKEKNKKINKKIKKTLMYVFSFSTVKFHYITCRLIPSFSLFRCTASIKIFICS